MFNLLFNTWLARVSGSQVRQDKLREMGFVDVLHKLTQALDPNLCDRYVRSTHNLN